MLHIIYFSSYLILIYIYSLFRISNSLMLAARPREDEVVSQPQQSVSYQKQSMRDVENYENMGTTTSYNDDNLKIYKTFSKNSTVDYRTNNVGISSSRKVGHKEPKSRVEGVSPHYSTTYSNMHDINSMGTNFNTVSTLDNLNSAVTQHHKKQDLIPRGTFISPTPSHN